MEEMYRDTYVDRDRLRVIVAVKRNDLIARISVIVTTTNPAHIKKIEPFFLKKTRMAVFFFNLILHPIASLLSPISSVEPFRKTKAILIGGLERGALKSPWHQQGCAWHTRICSTQLRRNSEG